MGVKVKMFREARIYIQRNLKTGKTEWFFKAREGDVGPFASKEIAKNELNAFINQCVENGNDGDRGSGNKISKLSREPRSFLISKDR